MLTLMLDIHCDGRFVERFECYCCILNAGGNGLVVWGVFEYFLLTFEIEI
jgi:hypothetical protein